MSVRSLLACIFALLAPTHALGADQAFAQNFLAGSKQIVRFPVGDPAAMTVVGPLTDTLSGMDFDPGANVLWAVNFTTQTLGTIDETTGVYASTVTLQDPCCISAFTVDPVDGTFYVSRGDEFIYTLNAVSGTTIKVAAGAPAGAQITALAMDCGGRLFAANGDPNAGDIYEAHLDADPTLVGNPGYVSATSLEFDNDSGTLYAWFFLSGGGNTVSTHGTVDSATAQVSQTSLLSGRYRMAVRNTCFRIFIDDFET